jgi:hypothetical protein
MGGKAGDLSGLPGAVTRTARIDPNGEVAWPRASTPQAIYALTAKGCIVLGLDLRRYDATGRVFEASWSSFEPSDDDPDPLASSRDAALDALRRADSEDFDDLDWVLVTWSTQE